VLAFFHANHHAKVVIGCNVSLPTKIVRLLISPFVNTGLQAGDHIPQHSRSRSNGFPHAPILSARTSREFFARPQKKLQQRGKFWMIACK
jgi:hypothetical protein